MKVTPVFEVSGAKEGGAEPSIRGQPLRDGLCDGALPCSSQSIQPVDGGFVKVSRPDFNFIQDSSAGTLEAAFTVTVSIFGLPCAAEVVEERFFSCQKPVSGAGYQKDGIF